MLVAAAPAENADDAEFGLPLAPPLPPGLIPPPELGVAALRAGVAAVALPPPPPKLPRLVAALRLPVSAAAGTLAAGPPGMPTASAAASILACDQPAWAADISGVRSDLWQQQFGSSERRGRV